MSEPEILIALIAVGDLFPPRPPFTRQTSNRTKDEEYLVIGGFIELLERTNAPIESGGPD